ncbi:MAG: ribose-phosphate diphosphokinase [Chloroflexi bacterium]|nr:ribose-phosphate diphosphokinase [Chloroflexota bacterium]MCL5952650.1 ribose-phosphate diphosphokinase [Chloroflexota bacterium]
MAKMYGELAMFSGRSNRPLAEGICKHLHVPLDDADVFDFPNENIFIQLKCSVRGQDVFLVQGLSSPVNRNIIELLIFLDALKRASAGRITAVIPFYAYGRSDKKDQPRIAITARLLADLVSVAGATRYMTIDLHAGQIQGFFQIPGDEFSAFPILTDYLVEKNIPNAVVVSADLGFAKKARNFARKLDMPLAFVEKRRIGNDPTAQAMTVIGDVQDKNVILVDDEVDTGGTLVEAVHLLKRSGAHLIYTACTHATLSHPAVDRLRNAPIDEFICTDTVPVPPEKRLPNFKILSVAPLLAETIARTHTGRSVGEYLKDA